MLVFGTERVEEDAEDVQREKRDFVGVGGFSTCAEADERILRFEDLRDGAGEAAGVV